MTIRDKAVRRMDQRAPLKVEIDVLRRACVAVAERVLPQDPYPALRSLCVEVSLTVRAVYGGDLLTGDVEGVKHYWNRLPDGKEVDLTSDQFGGDGITPIGRGEPTTVPAPLPLVYLVFISEANRALEGVPAT